MLRFAKAIKNSKPVQLALGVIGVCGTSVHQFIFTRRRSITTTDDNKKLTAVERNKLIQEQQDEARKQNGK